MAVRDAYAWRLVALSLTMLLPSLGTSIANVALPSLEAAFAASFSDVQWVVLSYLLAVTTLIVGAGRLADILGRRQLLLCGIASFALASAAATVAPTLWILVAARAVQGFGAATMMALTVASVADVVPAERTGTAMGLLGTVSAVGTALGPSLGGGLLSWSGWPAPFAFMAVTGAVAFLIGLWALPTNARRETGQFRSFDGPGMLLLAGSLGAFALAGTLGGAEPGPGNAALAVLAVGGVVVFAAVERRVPSPLVRVELLRDRELRAGLLSLGLVSAIVMATLVVGPFYLSDALGLPPLAVGLVMTIGPAVAAVVGLPAGRLVDTHGSPTITRAGLIGVTAGSALMVFLPGWLGMVGYVASLMVLTSGYALFQAANNASVMTGSAPESRGLTSALLGLSRNLGLITGASVMGTVFTLGSNGQTAFGPHENTIAGLQLTFTIAALFGAAALAITLRKGATA